MRDSFDISLLDTGVLFKRGYTALVNNAGKAIAAITLLVAILLTFTDVGFKTGGAAEYTAELFLMLVASYLMYFSMESAGERLGCESEEYSLALKEYRAAAETIRPADISALRAFCKRYTENELRYRKESKLAARGYTMEDYERFLSGEGASKEAIPYFKSVHRMRAAELTPRILLSLGESRARGELYNPEKFKLPIMLLKLLPSTVFSLFTVSIMLNIRGDMSAAAIIEGVLKLITLPVVGLRGYCCGYCYVKDSESLWLKTKARLLLAFISEARCVDIS